MIANYFTFMITLIVLLCSKLKTQTRVKNIKISADPYNFINKIFFMIQLSKSISTLCVKKLKAFENLKWAQGGIPWRKQRTSYYNSEKLYFHMWNATLYFHITFSQIYILFNQYFLYIVLPIYFVAFSRLPIWQFSIEDNDFYRKVTLWCSL